MTEARQVCATTRAAARSRFRLLLAASTALSAFAGIAPACAQSPLATPTGGTVVAGAARIGQAPGQTTITQATPRAAINWQGFDVGSRATVTFNQPSAQAVTLNRVLAPDPSTIAGRITANGSIVLVNPDGVMFAHGSEVNTAGLVVSAAGITNRNFMAGRMVFNQPGNPNARISNRGSITIAGEGLAALVAPEVANSGVIAAKLGSVVLAGARTATLDLYGDGLVSIDVTGAVRSVPTGSGGKAATALVTNTGTLIAQGGTVMLTAVAVDGLIRNLVDARGTISADGTPGAPAGTILVQGIGGSIRIAGTLSASGDGSGGTGGAIGLDATGSVAVAKTARLDVSGPASGGLVAVGTTLARARGGPGTPAGLTATNVRIAQGATIDADATASGPGGRITVLSTATTSDHGAISARGGAAGGNGGFAEVSGHDLTLDGSVDTSAPLGTMGSILLDPYNLQIVALGTSNGDVSGSGVAYGAGNITPGSTDTVSAIALGALFAGTVTVQAINNLEVSVNLSTNPTLTTQSLILQAGNSLIVDPGVTISASGNLEMDAASSNIPGFNPNGALIMNGVITAGGNISLGAGSFGMFVDGPVSTNPSTGSVTLTSGGAITEGGGAILADVLTGSSAGTALFTGNNAIADLEDFTAGGNFTLVDSTPLVLTGPVGVPAGDTITIETDSLTEGFRSPGSFVIVWGALSAPAGEVLIEPYTPTVPVALVGAGPQPAGTLSLNDGLLEVISANTLALASFDAEPITVSGANPLGGLTDPHTGQASGIGTLSVSAGGAFTESSAASLDVGVLTGSAASVALDGTNLIPILDDFSSSAGFALADAESLTVLGTLADPTGITLAVAPGALLLGVSGQPSVLTTGGTMNLGVPDGSITLPDASLTAGTLTGSASSLAAFGTADVATLGSFTVSGSSGEFSLASLAPLTITGPLSAAYFDIAAPGTLTLSGTITTTGLPLAQQEGAVPSLPGSVLEVLPGAAGTGSSVELGTSVIAPLGTGAATLRIQLPSAGGSASFSNLLAGGANLVLALGPGSTSGTMTVGSLLVTGTGGSANLFGSLAGVTGPAAAAVGRISPAINANYLFNSCVIETTVCAPIGGQVPWGTPSVVAIGGGPALVPFTALPALVLLTIPSQIGENWTDSGGFPLPNIAALDY
ncbi:MAG: filamentous hemagglutinin N-terminal domain-containing protein [Rhodospirillales bacterium]|nr:filamentous hemagglutinin N-terminal domain-containing protein [Rhodospirillales bacterium]